jgi:LmbE family N-acetylglucosaminyl deacetylase
MKFLNFTKVLCLSPHPDDIEYSMSATIKKNFDTKFDVICLTEGTSTDVTTNNHRRKEVNNYWKLFKSDNINLLHTNIQNFESMNIANWITYLDKIVENGYDAICTTSSNDSHQEHIFVNSIANSLVRNKPISIVEYKSPSTLYSWIPNYFSECGILMKKKYKALKKSFISQTDSLYFSKKCIYLFHSDYGCLKRNIRFSEQFKIVILYS